MVKLPNQSPNTKKSSVDKTASLKKPVKKRVIKYVRNLLLAVLGLAVLLVAAGVAYTWYVGQNSDNTTNEPVLTEAEPKQDIKPTLRAANAKIGVAVQYISSPVEPGMNASITVRSSPDAACKILVEYNKAASRDSGLVAKVADEYGMVSWTWTVEESVPIGKWPVTVTCTLNGKSAVVVGDLRVVQVVDQ